MPSIDTSGGTDMSGVISVLQGILSAVQNPPDVVIGEAAVSQMKELPFYHSFTGKTSEPTIRLAEKLIGHTEAWNAFEKSYESKVPIK